jgi:hypothetical protein
MTSPVIPEIAVITPDADIVVAETEPPETLDAVIEVCARPVHDPEEPVTLPSIPAVAVIRPDAVRVVQETVPPETLEAVTEVCARPVQFEDVTLPVIPPIALIRPVAVRVVQETVPPETFDAVTEVCARPVQLVDDPVTLPVIPPVAVIGPDTETGPVKVAEVPATLLQVTVPTKDPAAALIVLVLVIVPVTITLFELEARFEPPILPVIVNVPRMFKLPDESSVMVLTLEENQLCVQKPGLWYRREVPECPKPAKSIAFISAIVELES